MIEIDKKTLGILGIAFLIISAFVVVKLMLPKPQKERIYFTPEPDSWVEANFLTDSDSDVRINIMKATEGKSAFSGNKQDYFFKGEESAFFSRGAYKGEYFEAIYLEEGFYSLDLYNMTMGEMMKVSREYAVMEISPNMNPDDGIIQAFILARKDESGFVFYLFVDEDWKKSIGATNIIYGEDFYTPGTLLQREYVFKEIKKGIYMDRIDDYNGWYEKDPVTGGIILGQITIGTLRDSGNATFIYVR